MIVFVRQIGLSLIHREQNRITDAKKQIKTVKRGPINKQTVNKFDHYNLFYWIA